MADSITFEAGSTTHFTSWSVDGSVGNLIEINSSDGATTHYLVCDSGGPFTSTYLSISHSHATPYDQWDAVDSVDVIDNEGWFATYTRLRVRGGLSFTSGAFSNATLISSEASKSTYSAKAFQGVETTALAQGGVESFSENLFSLTQFISEFTAEAEFLGDGLALLDAARVKLFIGADMTLAPSVNALLEPGPIPVKPQGPR